MSISKAIMSDKGHVVRTIVSRNQFSQEDLGGWLALAASEGKIKAMKALVEKGASPKYQNSEGESPFSYACARNQLESAKLLYQFGADVNAELDDGSSPLDWAVCHSSQEFRNWLRSVGGKRNKIFKECPWTPQSEQGSAHQSTTAP